MILKRKEDFDKLTVGKSLYKIGVGLDEIIHYYYAGISPKSENFAMIISGSNITNMTTINISSLEKYKSVIYTDEYETAKEYLLDFAEKRVNDIIEVYFRDKDEAYWRDRKLKKIIL